MAEFTAKDVQALRQATGAGMMDAKRALQENGGDPEKAATWLREKGLSQAAKRSDRESSQGAVAVANEGGGAAIVELSWYGDKQVAVALGGSFHARRLTLKSSQVGHVAPSQRARWDRRRRMALALSLLAHDELDVLITGESAFDDLPSTMAALSSSAGDTICHRIRYDSRP